MFKKVKLIMIFGILSIIGCSNNSNNTKEINRTVVERNSSHEETILNEMGFNFKDNKIIIDLNKSTSFFSKIEKKINEKSKEIENKIRGIESNISKNSGIIVTEDKVNIDLNKTKSLLDNLSGMFRDIVKDINTSFN